jgi:hypothetical protein
VTIVPVAAANPHGAAFVPASGASLPAMDTQRLLEELQAVQQQQQLQAATHAQQLQQLQQQQHQATAHATAHAQQAAYAQQQAQQQRAAHEAQHHALATQLAPLTGAAVPSGSGSGENAGTAAAAAAAGTVAPVSVTTGLLMHQGSDVSPWHAVGQVTTWSGSSQHGNVFAPTGVAVPRPGAGGGHVPAPVPAQPSQAPLALLHPHPAQLITFGAVLDVPEHVRRWALQFTATASLLGNPTVSLPPTLLMPSSGGGTQPAAPNSAPASGASGAWTLLPCLALLPPRDG